MKKKLLILMLALSLSGVALTGCSSKTPTYEETVVYEDNSDKVEDNSDKVEDNLDKEEVVIDSDNNEIVETSSARFTKDEVVLMTQAYADYFKGLNSRAVDGVKYCIIDINMNGVPEIIYQIPQSYYYLVYLEKDSTGNYTAYEKRLSNHNDNNAVLNYNLSSGVIGNINEDIIELNDEGYYECYAEGINFSRYNDFCMQNLYVTIEMYNYDGYGFVDIDLSIPVEDIDKIGVDLMQYCYEEETGYHNYGYESNDSTFYIEVFEENDTGIDVEYYKNLYETIKTLLVEHYSEAAETRCALFSESLKDSMLDWCSSGQVDIDDLINYMGTTEFFSYFDYE